MPNKWKTYSVEELLKKDIIYKPLDGNHGGTHPKGSDFIKSGIPFIMATDIVNGKVDITNCKFISKKQADLLRKGFAKSGDVLITHKASIGRTAIVPKIKSDYIMLTPQVTYYRIKNNEELNANYLLYYFNSPFFQNEINTRAGSGSTRAYIGITDQLRLTISYPPLQEQKSIAQILSAIDDKIENNLAINKTLEEMAMALYKHWFVDFGPFQNGEFVDSELGSIPKGWEVKRLGDYITHKKGFAFKSSWYQPIGEMVVRVSDTTNNSIDIKSCEKISSELASNYQDYALKTDDVVIATVGSWPPNYSSVVGKVIRVPITAKGGLLNQNAVILNMHIDNAIQQGLLYCILKNERFLNYIVNSAQGSASQASIKLTDIFNYLIPFGTNINIEEFTMKINSFITQQNALILENQTLTQLRDTLLPKLISGEVRLKEFREAITN
jgi:type I restriction enzyme S subunit